MSRWFIIVLFFFVTTLHARFETYSFATPEDEARYQVLTEELRCLVCQNQNLADSNAELAQDLRRQAYEMVQAGKSSDEIVDYMVQRYGDFVLYRPPLRAATLLLWVGPFIFLLFSIVFLFVYIRRRARNDIPTLSPEDLARAEQLLTETHKEKPL